MRRIIEDLIEQRKKRQQQLTQTITRLADLLEKKSLFKREREKTGEILRQLHSDLDEWVTAQDREWDAYASNHATTVFKSLQWKIEKLEAEYSLVKTLLTNFVQLEKSLAALIAGIESKTDRAGSEMLLSIKDQLSVFQYAGFEERFRGTSATVRGKLSKYLPYFAQADGILDLGCGRGEFLELLREQGKAAFGIDISDSMLNQAREKGLDCRRGDALAALQEMAAESLGGIFSAQVVEHFPVDYLQRTIQESFRVLKKDSFLVVETINPLSLFALSRIFFLDPTHQKPLHPEYLRYLLESTGFAGVDIIYSDEPLAEKLEETAPGTPTALAFNRNVDRLNQVLFCSPEFAAVGKKS